MDADNFHHVQCSHLADWVIEFEFFPTVLSKIYTINILSSQYLIRYYCKYRHSHYILLIEYLLQDVL